MQVRDITPTNPMYDRIRMELLNETYWCNELLYGPNKDHMWQRGIDKGLYSREQIKDMQAEYKMALIRNRGVLTYLDSPWTQRMIFDARQAAQFAELGYGVGRDVTKTITPPFPHFFIEFTEPIRIGEQQSVSLGFTGTNDLEYESDDWVVAIYIGSTIDPMSEHAVVVDDDGQHRIAKLSEDKSRYNGRYQVTIFMLDKNAPQAWEKFDGRPDNKREPYRDSLVTRSFLYDIETNRAFTEPDSACQGTDPSILVYDWPRNKEQYFNWIQVVKGGPGGWKSGSNGKWENTHGSTYVNVNLRDPHIASMEYRGHLAPSDVDTDTLINTPTNFMSDDKQDAYQFTFAAGQHSGYVGFWERQLVLYGDIISWMLTYMTAKGIEIVGLPVSRAERRRGQREGYIPRPWHIVRVEPRILEGYAGESGGSHYGAHSYRYDVMGHLRFGRHKLGDGSYRSTVEWVRPHQRGLANSVYVPATRKYVGEKVVARQMQEYWEGKV